MSLFDESGRVLVSPSRLKLWMECPLKWKAVYVDEVRTAPTPALVFGSAIHKALELHHRSLWMGGRASTEELEQAFRLAVDEGCRPEGFDPITVDQDEFLGQARKLIELYVGRFGDEPVAAAELALSAPLVDGTGEDLGAQLTGIIDLVTADRRVIDLKSSARASDLFDVTVAHSVQLHAYRWLMLHSTGQEPKALEIRTLLRRKNPDVQVYTLPARQGFLPFLRLVRAYVEFVRRSEAPIPRPGFLCGETCAAYSVCRKYHGLEAA
jgi:hypothetical protein